MSNPAAVTTDCVVVGEYVDDSGSGSVLQTAIGAIAPTSLVGSFDDLWCSSDTLTEFLVLLRDGRTVAVRGHALTYAPDQSAGQNVYGIVVRNHGQEVFVGLFNTADVTAIFHGEIRTDRKIA